MIVPEFQTANKSLLMICNMVIVFAIYNVKILDKLISLVVLVILTASMFLLVNGLSFEIDINFSVYIFTALVLFLRLISEKYNYIEIPTSEVKKGMVISYSTILGFLPSNVKGLPKSTTEDVRSRLSQDEADSIARWEKTKYGKSHITIVRKIPFAIFIFTGTVIFVLLRMFVL